MIQCNVCITCTCIVVGLPIALIGVYLHLLLRIFAVLNKPELKSILKSMNILTLVWVFIGSVPEWVELWGVGLR